MSPICCLRSFTGASSWLYASGSAPRSMPAPRSFACAFSSWSSSLVRSATTAFSSASKSGAFPAFGTDVFLGIVLSCYGVLRLLHDALDLVLVSVRHQLARDGARLLRQKPHNDRAVFDRAVAKADLQPLLADDERERVDLLASEVERLLVDVEREVLTHGLSYDQDVAGGYSISIRVGHCNG